MKKYWVLFKVSLTRGLEYRLSNLLWVLVGILPAVFAATVWLSAFAGKTEIQGYNRAELTTYYFLSTLLWYFVGGEFSGRLSEWIRLGVLVRHLTKPLNPLFEVVFQEQAWKVNSFFLSLPVYFLVFGLLRTDLILAKLDFNLFLFLSAVFLSGLVFILLEIIIGLLSFWISNSSNLNALYWVIFSLLGGILVPLRFLPAVLTNLSWFLPFRYTFSLPLELYLRKLSGGEILFAFLVQTFWLVLLFILVKSLYKNGLRIYEAYGQ